LWSVTLNNVEGLVRRENCGILLDVRESGEARIEDM